MKALLIGVIAILAYLLGSIPFGLLVARARGVDLRQHGSGNIGATNVWRVMGRKYGLFTFFADAAKGWLAVTLAMWLARHQAIHLALPHGHERIEYFDPGFAGIAGALGAVLGHNFPVWLRFKGGKGVATSLGVIFGMMPLASLIVFAIWGAVLKLTRYVSLASLVAAMCLPVVVILLFIFGGMHSWANFFFSVAAALMVVVRHRPNISRLLDGTESRMGQGKTPPEAEPEFAAEQEEKGAAAAQHGAPFPSAAGEHAARPAASAHEAATVFPAPERGPAAPPSPSLHPAPPASPAFAPPPPSKAPPDLPAP